ncbi:MAG: hypothetical protein V7K56_36155 [Nostoc sp.]
MKQFVVDESTRLSSIRDVDDRQCANDAALCVLEWPTNVHFGGVFFEILEMAIASLFTQFSNDLIDYVI